MSILGVALTAQSGDLRWLFLALPLTLALLVTARFAPTGYRLAPDGVRVERKVGPKLIAYRVIRGADREARQVQGLTVTGSRGVFGRFGLFWNRHLGFYRLYLTNTTDVVWLATDNGWIALSPDRPAEFIERLRSRLAILERGEGAG